MHVHTTFIQRDKSIPSLQPILNEVLHYKTANTDDGARVDVAATNFWAKIDSDLSLM